MYSARTSLVVLVSANLGAAIRYLVSFMKCISPECQVHSAVQYMMKFIWRYSCPAFQH